ncbi:MAG: HlyD family efflux transporter periplasmic adaptor subunit [Planctomycetales bacterium]|nr:HlyD family efflux transporter periplasmic adaptor subunit [Planctomycetales bacterium]
MSAIPANAPTTTPSPGIPALRLVTSPRIPRRIAKGLVVMLILAAAAMLLAPWQQSVKGVGQVVAYAPLERQQTIQANISGRVYQWEEGIREGARVVKGQPIVELRDLDPEAIARLEAQQEASQTKLAAAEQVAAAYLEKLAAVTDAQVMAIAAAEQEIMMAQQKVEAENQGLNAAVAAEIQALTYYERQKQSLAAQLASQQDVEIAERKYKESLAKLKQAEAYVESAKSGLEAKKSQFEQKRREATGYIQAARAEQQKAAGEVALARKELSELDGKLAKQRSQIITAPRDGTIVRLLANEGGEIVKQGDPLFVLVPESAQRAVEIWVSGNDAPLVSPGRHVRLQFEGWPAVQFAGWPSVAVGTFGGTVVNVDATSNAKGQFRLLVLPDTQDGQEWPQERYLRQGVRANGWVLLNQVRLGYELWRQMNGFPPVVSPDAPKEEGKDVKKPKVKI